MTQEELDEIWKRFKADGRADDFRCQETLDIDLITEARTDNTWERKHNQEKWELVPTRQGHL